MANVIKHKNGTSDPSASDFNSVAELLINTATGKVFTKTDSSNVVSLNVSIDDTPVDGVTDEAISSNWAYDHNAGTGNGAHVPAAGSSGQFLKHDATWGTPSDATKANLSGATFTGTVVIDALTETIPAVNTGDLGSGDFNINPENGTIQRVHLDEPTGSSFSWEMDNGQFVLLLIKAANWTVSSWGLTFVGGSPPTLATSGYSCIEVWKSPNSAGTDTVFGCYFGDVA